MRSLVIAFVTTVISACSSADSSDPRASSGGNDDDSRDAGLAADVHVDPTGGRTSTAQACFAACQNTNLTCIPKGSSQTQPAFLELSSGGCKGKLGTQDLELKCGDVTVCIDDACVPATFSAFQFGYPAKDGKDTVCIKD